MGRAKINEHLCTFFDFQLDRNCINGNTPEMNFIPFAIRSGLLCLGLATTAISAQAQAPAAPKPAAAPAAAGAPALDFGDSSSATLTSKAWAALEAKNYPEVLGYTNKCIELYKTQAVAMQAALKEPAPKETASSQWALNDVGTCYFIQGKALDDQKDTKGAIAAYKALADTLAFAQCWDPKGWFWKPADAARKRLVELQFDAQ